MQEGENQAVRRAREQAPNSPFHDRALGGAEGLGRTEHLVSHYCRIIRTVKLERCEKERAGDR